MAVDDQEPTGPADFLQVANQHATRMWHEIEDQPANLRREALRQLHAMQRFRSGEEARDAAQDTDQPDAGGGTPTERMLSSMWGRLLPLSYSERHYALVRLNVLAWTGAPRTGPNSREQVIERQRAELYADPHRDFRYTDTKD